MSPLPFIDEHRRRVAASPERTWDALLRFSRKRLGRPAPKAFVALWRLEPKSGFEAAEEIAPRHLALRGRHRFSDYELAFDIDTETEGVTLRATTSAVFPGLAGRAYRALVIGSRGHRLAVQQMLASIARAAERDR